MKGIHNDIAALLIPYHLHATLLNNCKLQSCLSLNFDIFEILANVIFNIPVCMENNPFY